MHAALGFIALLCLIASVSAQEAGRVTGMVVSTWDAAPVADATITVRGTTLATKTDATGKYELKNVPPGEQVLRFSKSGYASAVVTEVRVIPGQVTTVNGNIRPEFYDMEEYEVTAEVFVEQTEKILFERQKSSAMMDAVGSEFASRVGAGNAAESIAKVSGATIVEGKFAVIRGLNDRYVSTTLNGANIPSADPYRQSASLDLFPSQVIDRVVVAKTFTPDQPGTFTGGGIDVITKSFPEKPFISVSVGTAYKSQASLNDKFLTHDGGGLDWAGMDDGTRALPGGLVGKVPPPQQPSTGPSSSPNYAKNLANARELDRLTRILGTTDFAPRQEAPPLDHNLAMAAGGATNVFGNPLGYFVGANYKHDYTFYDEGVSRRYQQGTQKKSSYRDARSLSVVNWATMVNLAYQPLKDHELGFTFFYNQNGTDESRLQDHGYEVTDSTTTFRKHNLYYTERNLNTYQMKGEHKFPEVARLQFNWLVALTETSQDEPDGRFFNDNSTGGDYASGGNNPGPKDPTRYFRDLQENNRNIKLDWLLPFNNWTEEEGQFKFGLFDSHSERTFTDRAFYYPGSGGYGNDPNRFLTAQNLGLLSTDFRVNPRSGTTNALFTWGRTLQVFDSLYNGDSAVQAGYLMLDVPVVNHLRLVGGVRYETTELDVYSESYLASSVTSLKTNTTHLVQYDLLPAAGLIYSINSNMNVRVNYSQTVARPTFRELAAYFSWDPNIGDFIEGNPLLKMTAIDNYDVRWEWFPTAGSLLSCSLFYKELKNAIERGNINVEGDVITFQNREKATLYGMEVEARKSLDFLGSPFELFTLGGNVSLVQSEVKLTSDELKNKRAFFPNLKSTRPLYDQSPYIFNLDASFNNPRSGTTASIIYNVAGPRIALTKLNAEDVYEQPTAALDFVASQKIGKSLSVKFAAKNLLDPKVERTYGRNSQLLYSSYRRGLTFALSLTYDF